jgi:hypothetical protein
VFIHRVVLKVCAPNDFEGNNIVKKNVSLHTFGIKRKIKHSSFLRCTEFKKSRTITNKMNGKNVHILHFFVDVDMFL